MRTLIRRYRAQRGHDEAGFSLPELLVVTLILGIVSLALFATLDALTAASAATSSKNATNSEAQGAIEQIARDLRAANPVDAIAAASATSVYDNTISFSVFCSGGTGCSNGLRPVEYQVAGNALTKRIGTAGSYIILGPSDTPSVPTAERRGAIVNSASEPVFTYYDRDGVVIATSSTVGSGRPSTYFRDCTKSVQIHLKVVSQARRTTSPAEFKTVVHLRNYNEVNPC